MSRIILTFVRTPPSPNDGCVLQEVLGVLYNVSKDYDHAVEAFKTVRLCACVHVRGVQHVCACAQADM